VEFHTIKMDPAQARRAYLQYRLAVKQGQTREDREILRGYLALARGRQVISLQAAIRAGGVDGRGLPRLAACRADARWCYTEGAAYDGSITFRMDRVSLTRDDRRRVRLPAGTLPAPRRVRWQTFAGMVPMVPPPLRPAGSLAGHHILWDVTWQQLPPEDPALLKHIGGDLYAVVAVWHLTELERAVLSGRGQAP
jgi:hypothetical protein